MARQSRVMSIRIDPKEVILPTITPPTAYTATESKQLIINKLYSNPDNPNMIPMMGKKMTFKQQLELEEQQRKREEEK